jgi:hypothetical protein
LFNPKVLNAGNTLPPGFRTTVTSEEVHFFSPAVLQMKIAPFATGSSQVIPPIAESSFHTPVIYMKNVGMNGQGSLVM